MVRKWPQVPNDAAIFRLRWKDQQIYRAQKRQQARDRAAQLKAECDAICATNLDGKPSNPSLVADAAQRLKCRYSKRSGPLAW